jgi:outer membrane protein assembly factor BamD
MFAPGALLVAVLLSGCSSLSLPWSNSAPANPTAEALFQDGTQFMKDKRYVRAVDSFNKLKVEHPFSPLLTEADLKIADAYYLNEQYPEAINAFKEFQSLHPTSEHIPFVVLRLGESHFNQFTNVNRDQKNTEIARDYFQAVLANHPKSPQAAQAKEKLAKCNGILGEHEFNIADFYFKQEKYPAARDRFEEIVRKYPGTPVAARSLFFLGESYRKEKNSVKAALAYEALLGHYPDNQFSAEAKAQLAQIEKEKHDPLAMLLMRDRRPVAAPVEAKPETAVAVRAKEADNLVAKTEVVYEAPGGEKTMFRRVVDKINPFGSSDNEKQEDERKQEEKSAVDLLAKSNAEKTESKGFFASLWPFGGNRAKTVAPSGPGKTDGLVKHIDGSLKQQGIDADAQTAALKPPAADLPNVDDLEPKPASDTSKLLLEIDSNLKKEGKSVAAPPPPEPAEGFKTAERARAASQKIQPKAGAEESSSASDLLGSIDEKLKSQGIVPGNFESAPAVNETEVKAAPPREINLEPKAVKEKGPLFLNPADAPTLQQPAPESEEIAKPESATNPEEPAAQDGFRPLVRGPQAPPAAKPEEPKKPAMVSDEENKGTFEQLQKDLKNAGKVLNPFSW